MTARLKICGLSTPQTVDAALALGVDMIGLVFYPPSPRNVSIETARKLANRARGKSSIVALTVDATDDLLDQIMTSVKPDYIQAHGSETPQRVDEISNTWSVPVIKVFKVRSPEDIKQIDQFENVADMLAFDAKAPSNDQDALPGGNGIAFDWSLLDGTKTRVPFMLQGGLNVDNIAAAVSGTNAGIFDVSSGVESTPGVKDVATMKKFVEAFRAAS